MKRAPALVCLLSMAACGSDTPEMSVHDAAPVADAEPADTPVILSAYHGLDQLPAAAGLLCGAAAIGEDGMPVTFSVQLDDTTVTPEAFAVETATGETVTPICATLSPATEPLERRTVLLAGAFGTPAAPPRAVEVVGDMRDTSGDSLRGVTTDQITPLAAGPKVVLAERFAPDTPGLEGECPTGTEQVIQLTWEGGVTGAAGAPLGEPQRLAVSITLEDAQSATPISLADDDPDNFVLVCLDTATPARSVTVGAGQFHDPADDANPETGVDIGPGFP